MTTVGILLLIFGVVAGVSFFMVWKNREGSGPRILKAKKEEKQLEGPNLNRLRVGDIVSYLGQDFVVEGKATYVEEGYTWVEYRIVDGSDERWLEVEVDETLETALYRYVEDLPLTEDPPREIDYQGEKYRQVERGTCTMRMMDEHGDRLIGRVYYFDYEGPEGKLLSVERTGESFEASVGYEVSPGSIDILPGSPAHTA